MTKEIIHLTVAAVLVTGCDSTLNPETTNPSLVQSTKIPCTESTNPLVGCWVADGCYYNPRDFNADGEREDYWSNTVVSFAIESRPYTHNGIQANTDGRYSISAIYYQNDSCSGNPSVSSFGLLDEYYRDTGLTFTTIEGLDSKVVLTISAILIGYPDVRENLRNYEMQYINGDSMCWAKDEAFDVNLGDYEGDEVIVKNSIDFTLCFTRADPGTASWMTEEIPPWIWDQDLLK